MFLEINLMFLEIHQTCKNVHAGKNHSTFDTEALWKFQKLISFGGASDLF